MTEVQITHDHPEYDNVTRVLGDLARWVPDERCWIIDNGIERHLEVETFVRGADGNYVVNEANDDVLINDERTIISLD
ncbi:hypothetical protein [Williamsia phyllosphaerae]|uniref:Uncharacterized protein n=1 Tax=Williamsia phyllosphaerae TaxID=885042 RepID=A0ABQ1V564_9NOCA|nr:hypothetical protein [Williamsia phyllosphaerae]GGF39014.1 hypothetical protein GCM10007298_38390 [Williamsia phyllosphaerae]